MEEYCNCISRGQGQGQGSILKCQANLVWLLSALLSLLFLFLNLGDFKRKVQTDFENHQTIRPREKAKTLNNLLKKIFEKKSEFNEKVLLIKDEKTEVLGKLDKLSQNLVDIQYLLEPADRKTVPTIPNLDTDEHVVDPFEIDPKLVESIKEKLYQVSTEQYSTVQSSVQNRFQEADDMVADKKSGMTGSRRSSVSRSSMMIMR